MRLPTLSVGLRIALVVATFPTVMAIAVGLVVPRIMDHAAFSSFRERAEIQADLLAHSAAVGLEFDDPEFIRKSLDQRARRDRR